MRKYLVYSKHSGGVLVSSISLSGSPFLTFLQLILCCLRTATMVSLFLWLLVDLANGKCQQEIKREEREVEYLSP